jgi:hypothetical protein
VIVAAERMMAGSGDGEASDVHVDMTHLTFDAAAKCLFGADFAANAAAVSCTVLRLMHCCRATAAKTWRRTCGVRSLAAPARLATRDDRSTWRPRPRWRRAVAEVSLFIARRGRSSRES